MGAVVGRGVDVAGEGSCDGGFDPVRAGGFLPFGADDDADAAGTERQQAPARGEFLFSDDALGGEDVVDVGHGLGEAGFEFSQADFLAKISAKQEFGGVFEIARARSIMAKSELAFLGRIAEEIKRGSALHSMKQVCGKSRGMKR